MKLILKSLFAAICISFILSCNITPTPVNPIKKGTINGVVRDGNNTILSGVKVVAKSASKTYNVITNINGHYKFDKVEPSQYELTFSKDGYVNFTSELLTVIAGQETLYNTVLQLQYTDTGTISGSVKDISTDTGLTDVTASSISDIRSFTVKTALDGSYSLVLPVGNYKFTFSKPGYINTTYYDVNVTKNQTTYLEVVLQIPTTHTGLGIGVGGIVNALNGQAVGGAKINLRSGINNTTGPVLHTATTNFEGQYSFNKIEAGHYTAEVSKANFLTNSFSFIILGNKVRPNQNSTITPVLSPTETRIVLTWGAKPTDLDSHLVTPKNKHIYYAEKRSPNVNLDLDDTTSYGPETITIATNEVGIYTYYIHNFTNRASTSSSILANSTAAVKVFKGSDLVATLNVPNKEGTLWKVLKIDNGVITPINKMLYEYKSNVVNTRSQATISEQKRFKNLPTK